MKKVTDIRPRRSEKRVNIVVNNTFTFTLDAELVTRVGLQVGQELSSDEFGELLKADFFQSCFGLALHYLSYRPRSEAEVRRRLRRSFDSNVVEEVIANLKEQKLIDDVAFAEFWKDNRVCFSPRSRRLISCELKKKGVVDEIVEEVTKDLDDEASAYVAGSRKARLLGGLDYSKFRQRLVNYLKWRGFSYEIIKHIIDRLWQEQSSRQQSCLR